MKCEDYLEFLSAYLEGDEIPKDAREHFESCQFCLEEEKKLKRLIVVSRDIESPSLSRMATLKIKKALEEACGTFLQKDRFCPIMDLDELSYYLKIEKSELEKIIDEIPYFTIGGKVRFRKEKIDQWIKERETQGLLNRCFKKYG